MPALYFASPTNAKQHAILPDNSLKRVRSHDSWLVLDFFPHAMMGHTLYLFGIETNMTEQACLKNKGILVGKLTSKNSMPYSDYVRNFLTLEEKKYKCLAGS